MKNRASKNFRSCSKFLHLSIYLMTAFLSTQLYAVERTYLVEKITRKPASAPEEEVMTTPAFDKPLLLAIFADDDAGIMNEMRTSVSNWETQEQYAKNWNLLSTGVYTTPDTTAKRQYLANKLLKYADKRLAGEVRNAEEGSTLHAVGKVEKTLRPNTTVNVSKYFSLKFKARVLQGKAIMELKNPWMECSTTLAATGKIKVLTKKEFKEIGLDSGLEYTTNDGEWVAFLDHKFSENLKARLSSTQKDQSVFNNNADKKVEMIATFPLNF